MRSCYLGGFSLFEIVRYVQQAQQWRLNYTALRTELSSQLHLVLYSIEGLFWRQSRLRSNGERRGSASVCKWSDCLYFTTHTQTGSRLHVLSTCLVFFACVSRRCGPRGLGVGCIGRCRSAICFNFWVGCVCAAGFALVKLESLTCPVSGSPCSGV
jgi:hypothetical protein